jgi:hypothetical protein
LENVPFFSILSHVPVCPAPRLFSHPQLTPAEY